MRVYTNREMQLPLTYSLDDGTLLDVAKFLNAKANLDSMNIEVDQELAGQKKRVIMINEGYPITLQDVIKETDRRVSFRYFVGDCVRIPFHGENLFLSCNNDQQSFVFVYRPNHRYEYIPYTIYVACFDKTTLRIKETLNRFTWIGNI